MLAAYAILVLCNVVAEAVSNIAQEKFRQLRQHLVTLFTYVYMRSFMSKNIKLSFLYYENRLKLRLKQQLGILPSNWSNF